MLALKQALHLGLRGVLDIIWLAADFNSLQGLDIRSHAVMVRAPSLKSSAFWLSTATSYLYRFHFSKYATPLHPGYPNE